MFFFRRVMQTNRNKLRPRLVLSRGRVAHRSTSMPLAVLLVALFSVAVPRVHADSKPPDVVDAGCAEAIAARVQTYYESVVDFRASFEQVTQSITLGNTSMGADAPSRGVVQFAKPGKMRWHYESPSESLVISDNKVLWIYDPVAREAQRLPVAKDYLTGAALEFLLGDGQILEEFEVSAASCTPDSDGKLMLKLVPKKPASYEYLGLGADVVSGEISYTHLVDLFGNKTAISFSEMRTNLSPPDTTFQFEIPDGVRVIDLVVKP